MQATLDQEIQDGAKAAAEKLAAQREEQRCRTEALESQIKLQRDNHEAQLSALSAKHREQVHTPHHSNSHSNIVPLNSNTEDGDYHEHCCLCIL